VTPAGALDRDAMRRLVFEDPLARSRLEEILHPRIRGAADEALAAAAGPYAMLAVPLLFETGGYARRVQRTLVIDCPEALQVERVVRRSGLAADEVRAVMAALDALAPAAGGRRRGMERRRRVDARSPMRVAPRALLGARRASAFVNAVTMLHNPGQPRDRAR
jgi:hypothetical protein